MRAWMRDWRFWFTLAALAGVVIWLAYQGDMTCRIPRKRAQMEIFKANSCFEFWVGRYQSLIAGILALIGALWTIRMMQWQMATAERRATTVARLNAASELMIVYEKMSSVYFDISACGTPLYVEHTQIPPLSFNKNPDKLADLDTDLALRLFDAADLIDDDNLNAVTNPGFDNDDTVNFIRIVSADHCRRIRQELNVVRKQLGWPVRANTFAGDSDFAAALAEADSLRAERSAYFLKLHAAAPIEG